MTYRSLLQGAAFAALIGGAAPLLSAIPAQAETVSVREQLPASFRFTLGKIEITALSDGTVPSDLHKLLLNTNEGAIDAHLQAAFQANPTEASINAFLIQDGDRRILVDTGAGELFGPGFGGKLVTALGAVGVAPAQITDILITHIHTDHTGGLVSGGAMVFPNATLHVGKPDLDFFLDAANAKKTGYAQQYFDEAAKTMGPYVKAGHVKAFAAEETVLPGIVASVHPGHTPGSAFYKLTSDGQSILFVGDIVHSLPVQMPEPSVAIVYDVDPKGAVATREAAFTAFARDRQLIAAPHLPFPGVGHVTASGKEQFSWVPLLYRNRASQ